MGSGLGFVVPILLILALPAGYFSIPPRFLGWLTGPAGAHGERAGSIEVIEVVVRHFFAGYDGWRLGRLGTFRLLCLRCSLLPPEWHGWFAGRTHLVQVFVRLGVAETMRPHCVP